MDPGQDQLIQGDVLLDEEVCNSLKIEEFDNYLNFDDFDLDATATLDYEDLMSVLGLNTTDLLDDELNNLRQQPLVSLNDVLPLEPLLSPQQSTVKRKAQFEKVDKTTQTPMTINPSVSPSDGSFDSLSPTGLLVKQQRQQLMRPMREELALVNPEPLPSSLYLSNSSIGERRSERLLKKQFDKIHATPVPYRFEKEMSLILLQNKEKEQEDKEEIEIFVPKTAHLSTHCSSKKKKFEVQPKESLAIPSSSSLTSRPKRRASNERLCSGKANCLGCPKSPPENSPKTKNSRQQSQQSPKEKNKKQVIVKIKRKPKLNVLAPPIIPGHQSLVTAKRQRQMRMGAIKHYRKGLLSKSNLDDMIRYVKNRIHYNKKQMRDCKGRFMAQQLKEAEKTKP